MDDHDLVPLVKETDRRMILEFLNASACKVLRSRSEATPGSSLFYRFEELEHAISWSTMDEIRGKLLGVRVESASQHDAAKLLWNTLMTVVPLQQINLYDYEPRSSDRSKIEFLRVSFSHKRDYAMDVQYKSLPGEAQLIMRFLLADGRNILDQGKILGVLRSAGLPSPDSTFAKHRALLIRKRFLRRVSSALASTLP